MSGRYNEYSDQASQRPPYPARPDGQRQGQAPRGPRQGPPSQPMPRQGPPSQPMPRQGPPSQPMPPYGTSPQPVPPRGASPRRTQQPPWQGRPPQAGGDPRDQRQRGGHAAGFDAGPGRGDGNNGFLPGWDSEDLAWDGDGEESFWDDDRDRGRGRGRRGRSGAQQQVRDRDDRYDEDYARPARGRRRRFRWLAPLVALLVIATPLGAGGYFGYNFYMNKYHPADYSGSGYGSVVVHVPSGANATSLAPQLQKLGVVASSRALVLAAEHSTSGTLEVGYFNLHTHMQASQAWAILTNPKNLVETLARFPEGLRAASILSLLGKNTKISLSAYQAAIKNTAALGLPAYAKGKVEGYLFPATYEVTPNETALQVLQAMVTKYNQEAQALHLSTAAASKVGLSPGQLMIVASLVQAEGGRVSDYPKIASVVYNRLKIHMKLQFDSAVLYGVGKFGTRASNADLASKSPYNTYMYTGLPPTPIDSPGVAAIEAALNPAHTNYLYFLSFKNGSTKFSANPITG